MKDRYVIALIIFFLLYILGCGQTSGVHDSLYSTSSKISGIGIHTRRAIPPDTFLFTALIDGRITPQCGLINHCNKPNCGLIKKGRDRYDMYSLTFIPVGTELTADYNEAPDFVQRPDPSWTC